MTRTKTSYKSFMLILICLCSVSHLPAASCRYLFSSFDLRVPAYCTGCLFRFDVLSAGMSRVQGPSSLKRKRPELNSPVQSLTEHERILYDVIRSKQDIGIWTRDMKKEAKLPDNVVNKSLKALTVKNLIKEVVNIQNKGRKHFMATEFEPSKEITGGAWYLEGSLDTEFIESLRQLCKRQIEKKGVATLEEVTDMINSYPAFNVEVTKQQIDEILRTLILDNAVMEVKSNGMGEFASIPFGKVCYRYISKGALGGEPKAGALASIPCGVCPRISHCTPDGIISPKTCVYYQKWLDF
nr:DNA-directed RNA polymerase III subunit RPC6-like isoform X1 [Populus alba]